MALAGSRLNMHDDPSQRIVLILAFVGTACAVLMANPLIMVKPAKNP